MPIFKVGNGRERRGYAIQGRAGLYIRQITGSYSNIVGLDMHTVAGLLLGTGFIMFSLTDGLLLIGFSDPQLYAVIERGRLVDLWTPENSLCRARSILARITGRFEQHNRVTGRLANGQAVSWPAKATENTKKASFVLVTVTAAAREASRFRLSVELSWQVSM